MTSRNSVGEKAFTATAVALAAFVRVKLDSSGNISVAGATDDWIGETTEAIAASGTGNVRLRGPSRIVTCSAAVACGARLYPTAAGKVDDAIGSGVFTGLVAGEAGTADNAQIEAFVADHVAFTAHADQAVATDAATTLALANALRSALVTAGIIKGAA
jgi:hypothetical protein